MILDPRQKSNFLDKYEKNETLKTFEVIYQSYSSKSSVSVKYHTEKKKSTNLSLLDRYHNQKRFFVNILIKIELS